MVASFVVDWRHTFAAAAAAAGTDVVAVASACDFDTGTAADLLVAAVAVAWHSAWRRTVVVVAD